MGARLAVVACAVVALGCGPEVVQLPEPQLQCSHQTHFEKKRGCVLNDAPRSTGIAVASPAAPTDVARARQRFNEGKRLYDDGDFEGALRELDAAESLHPTPQTERLIGLSHDTLGHAKEATAAYTKFLEHVPESMSTEADEARARIEALKEVESP